MTKPTAKSEPSDRQDRAEQTRKAILGAAIAEFSAHGLSGARTEAIAEAAGANKALLYYYFKSKNGLYEAAIEEVSGKVVEDALAALDPAYSAGERLLRTAITHFDRILTKREFQSLMQQELIRFKREEGASISHLFQNAFKPLMRRMQDSVQEGIRNGELCKMDPMQVMYSIFGANVFYFLSAPMVQLDVPFNLFDRQALQMRRKAAVEYLGNALFSDRARGAQLAKRVLREMPMPQTKDFKFRRTGS
jgi:TetR/AcrR family transcriptional regulator